MSKSYFYGPIISVITESQMESRNRPIKTETIVKYHRTDSYLTEMLLSGERGALIRGCVESGQGNMYQQVNATQRRKRRWMSSLASPTGGGRRGRWVETRALSVAWEARWASDVCQVETFTTLFQGSSRGEGGAGSPHDASTDPIRHPLFMKVMWYRRASKWTGANDCFSSRDQTWSKIR